MANLIEAHRPRVRLQHQGDGPGDPSLEDEHDDQRRNRSLRQEQRPL